MLRAEKFIYLLIFCLGFSSIRAEAPVRNDHHEIRKEVAGLLSKMTLAEKVGQMTQMTVQAVSYTNGPKRQQMNPQKLREAILKYHVGSILNVYDSALTVQAWDKRITEIQNIATKETRLKIPILYGIDAIHGATYTRGATLFPQPLDMAATFDTTLLRKEGAITALEVRASGIPWVFYPLMGLGRQPLWPRLYETFGEDPYLAGRMGVSYIEGAQGGDIGAPDKVATCLKHYAGYGFPLDGKDRTMAWIPWRMMEQYYLPPFKAGVDAGAPTIMVNSAEVNGIPGHANYRLLTQVLRKRWKFKGFVVSDWQDIERLYTKYRIASSPEDAVRLAVMSGVDMSMVPLDYSFYNLLIKLVRSGKVPMWRVNQAVSRILRVKFELGLFRNPYPDKNLIKKFASQASDKTNLEAAEEAITLVKNKDSFLPLPKKIKLLVAGPTADRLSTMNGGWTITWQGNAKSMYPKSKLNPLQAIEAKVGKKNVTYVQGCSFDSLLDVNAAVEAAKKADAVVLCLGEHTYAETPGNINSLALPWAQIELAQKLISTGKPVVLVMFEGRPRVINRIVGGSKAILLAFLPGMEGGRALANILFGDADPSGRLPITYPRYVNALYHYDHDNAAVTGGNTYDPQWNFGYGLSYTTFKYSELNLSKEKIGERENEIVTVDVTNTGHVAGRDAVLLYLGEKYRQVSHPIRQLEGFGKVMLNPGQTKELRFTITSDQLSFVGMKDKWIIQPGVFSVTVGNLRKDFTVVGPRVRFLPAAAFKR